MPQHGRTTSRIVALISSLVMLLTMMAPVGAQESTPSDSAESSATQENTPAAEKIDEDLEKIFETEDEAQFLVLFEEKADTSAATGISDWEERGRYVYETLTRHAEETQADVIADLDARGVEYQSFWIVNTVLVTGTSDTAMAMAAHPEVEKIEFARNFEIPEPEPVEPNNETQATEWGLNAINAPDVWDQYGATGQGIVVGVIDSGVQWDHPALINHYRGNVDGDVDHEYNWFDPTRACGDPSPEPCAVFAHGTHVTGTVAGDDGGDNQIGVAPGAKWITAVGCDIPPNNCSTAALLGAGQWMAAPTDTEGNNENPDMRPHIVNNSWGGPGGDDWYMEIVDNWIAFGMFPQFASGNPGPACGAAGSPGDYAQSYSTGGFDINGNVYVNSGRGPSAMDGGTKPNISAPAVNVRSSVPGDGYANFTGTSMASPHVAGAVAVVWSAAPALVGDVDGTKELLNQTAIDTENLDCGGAPENNNVWGEGKLDLLASMNAAPIGDTGTVAGTVTDSGGAPIAGATVEFVGPFERTATTGDDGAYSILLPVGDYTATASAYGYVPEPASVTVTADSTTTQDFTLTSAPSNTVTGTVTDAGGHGWPLYARIDVPEHPDSPFFTDPVTGEYSVDLLESTEYTMEVSAVVPGYVPETRTVTVPPDDTVQDFALDVDVLACTAPGYVPDADGVYETFDTDTLPEGWEVVDNTDPPTGQVWVFNDPGERGNLTGGEGNFAIVDSDEYGSDGVQNTELISPPVDFTQFENPSLDYKTDYNDWSVDEEIASVDLSVDNGETWEQVWVHQGADFRGDVHVDLPQAADAIQARIRFHYYDADFAFWWQVDDVLMGELLCLPEESGVVVGNVSDLDTGDPIVGATVTMDDSPEITTDTVATPDDPGLDDGFYILTVPGSGDTTLTASMNQYAPSTETVTVVADGVVAQDFQLASGQLAVTPDSLSATLEMGETATQELEISNVGSGAASFSLLDSETGFDPASGAPSETLSETGAPELRIEGEFSPLQSIGDQKEDASVSTPPETSDEPWVDIADYPSNLMDASAATGPDGLVYVVGGIVASGSPLDTLRAYDPATDTWSDKTSMQNTRQKPGVAFVGDQLYVAAGWSETGATQPRTDIYDPATDTWTSGADVPTAHAAPGVAVVDDVIYLIGGCQDACGSTDVFSYDTSSDTWSTETDYPLTISWTHCGAFGETIYCAGGIDSSSGTDTATDATYSYDPATGTWTEVAPLPETLWAGASIATTEHLMISGGVTDGFATVSNVGYFYDPAVDSWDSLPNANNARYRSAGACGFYKIGGSISNFNADPASEHLPGFDQCGSGDAPWLSQDPTEGTLAPGESTTVTVTYDASVDEVDTPGVYHANILVSDDTPHSVPAVPVEMTVNAPANWGKIDVNVEGLEHCDAPGSPLAGASVDINGTSGTTDGDGYYFNWIEQGTYTVAVSADGFVSDSGEVTVVAGEIVAIDFSLRPVLPCGEITPDAFDFVLKLDASGSGEINFANTGAADLEFEIGERPITNTAAPADLKPVDENASSPAPDASQEGSGESAALAGTKQTGQAPEIQDIGDWSPVAALTGGTVRFGKAQCPGELGSFYKIAGVTTSAAISDETSRYDAATDTWTQLAPMPEGGREAPTATCTDDGRIHVIGGTSGGVATDTHFVYDIASDTWEQAAPAPRIVWTAASAVWNGKLYLVGGANSTTVGLGKSAEVNIYDIATDTWEDNAEPMPVAMSAMGYTQAGSYLYVVGGWGENAPSNETTTFRFDLDAGTWETGPEFASARGDLGLAVTD
ncbi:MAG: S8 family serine peptidase, partial [Acidimicrobiia bacterium]|nr:S8 family serine peptidase [Acidimicrobiia bacterium]